VRARCSGHHPNTKTRLFAAPDTPVRRVAVQSSKEEIVDSAFVRLFTRVAMLALVIAALAPAPLTAQAVGSVTGLVTDQETGRPLEGVQVWIPELNRGQLTQANGRYFLINVPVGTYAVEARLIGYATLRHENVVVSTDITRVVNFTMVLEAIAAQELIITVDRVPLVELTAAGSQSTVTADELAALPVTSVAGALSLQQGFFEVPSNTDILSLGEVRRNVLSPIRIRGGRSAETLMVIDGIPVNNWVLGGPSIEMNPKALAQIDLLRGGLEPQYGNALSGVVNMTTREGTARPTGALEYRTSAFAGSVLGSRRDELRDYQLFEGFFAGTVPFVPNDRLRYVVAGRQEGGRADVLQFDDLIYIPSDPTTHDQNPFDLWPGWRGFGFDQQRDVFGKLTYYISPTSKVSAWALDYRREYQPFDFRYLLTYDDPLSSPAVQTAEDSAAYLAGRLPARFSVLGVPLRYQDVVVNSARLDRQLYVLSYDQTLSRGFLRGAFGRYDQGRLTCNWFQGVCLEDRFQERSFTQDRFVTAAPAGRLAQNPTAGTDDIFGGEQLESYVARGDVSWRATDNHNLQGGIFFQTHSIDFLEAENININDVKGFYNEFKVDPWEMALYLQDRIEYNFLTLSLGFRYDYSHSPGIFFNNPLDPTNGTTAAHVICDPQNPLWQNVNVRTIESDENGLRQVTRPMSADPSWSQFCTNPANFDIDQIAAGAEVIDAAMLIASSDDMREARSRSQFSPRIRVSFPVTETSSFFFNFGRYSQNPTIRNMYNHTGIGTVFEGIPYRVAQLAGVENDDFRGPRTHDDRASVTQTYVGNSALQTERTTSYEVGWLAQLGDNFGMGITLFAKDQSGLTSYRLSGQLPDGSRVFDVGRTYGNAQPLFGTLVNSDFQTVRGFDIQFRRRLANYWGFDVNYSFSQYRTNARALDRQVEAFSREAETRSLVEVPSEIDQPHVFNLALRFAAGADAPPVPLGTLLANTSGAVVLRAASGLPYTPTLTFLGGTTAAQNTIARLDLNSGRAPAIFQVDLMATKGFRVGAVQYAAFAQVVNLFDRVNCTQVFSTTGRCESGAIDQGRAALGFSNTQQDPSILTTTVFDRPDFSRRRRDINVGLRVGF
jgi:hypothetical protein